MRSRVSNFDVGLPMTVAASQEFQDQTKNDIK